MSKKHFIQFANQIKPLVDSGHVEEAKAAAYVVIAVASEDNIRFDVRRFLAACGL
jgi:hypothetical protein